MRIVAFIVVVVAVNCLAVPASAARLSLDAMGEPFYVKRMTVAWAAPTNHLPPTVRIFRVAPSIFTPTIISNLTSLGQFTERDRVKAFVPGMPLPGDGLGFVNQAGRRSLSILPDFGIVHFRDELAAAAMHPRQAVEGLPDDERAEELAFALLARLGVTSSEQPLASVGTGPASVVARSSRGYFDKSRGKYVNEACTRSVSFTRRVDGLKVVGGGRQGVEITFGNHERVQQINVTWPGLQALATLPFAGTDQILTWIREGRARVQSLETTGARRLKMTEIKRVIVREISPHYFAGDGEAPVSHLLPYAVIKADAEMGPDDVETIWLFCPVVHEWLSRSSRKIGDFCVFPSLFHERMAHDPTNAPN